MDKIKIKEYSKLLKESVKTIKQVKSKVAAILKDETQTNEKITQLAILIIEEQSETKNLLKKGFSGLALQNVELLDQNKYLKDQIELLQEQLKQNIMLLEEMQKEKALFGERKKLCKNRKKLPRREPINLETYNILISEAENIKNKYLSARLRIALALLFITGVQMSELLPLKVS